MGDAGLSPEHTVAVWHHTACCIMIMALELTIIQWLRGKSGLTYEKLPDMPRNNIVHPIKQILRGESSF